MRYIKNFCPTALAIILAALLFAAPASAADAASGDAGALNDYLHNQRLPLVNAQISSDASGRREVIVYGYTATDTGKQHAAQRVREYLRDPNVKVENRIQVRSELANLGSSTSSSASSSATSSTASTGSAADYTSAPRTYTGN